LVLDDNYFWRCYCAINLDSSLAQRDDARAALATALERWTAAADSEIMATLS
jgi:hypothetical protein